MQVLTWLSLRSYKPSQILPLMYVYAGGPAPVVIRGAMQHWPAMTKWHDMDYLSRVSAVTGCLQYCLLGHLLRYMLCTASPATGRPPCCPCSASSHGTPVSQSQLS